MIETRWSVGADAEALARVHGDAWRYAYAGVIPGLALERRIATHGPRWWAAMHRAGRRALVVEYEGAVMGYATLGRSRWRGLAPRGEIYELYLDPICHGAGLGRRLFDAARDRLNARGLRGLIVWSLTANETGCRFYRALGGQAGATCHTCMGGARLEQIAFAWT